MTRAFWLTLMTLTLSLPASADTFWQRDKKSSTPKEHARAVDDANDLLANARLIAINNEDGNKSAQLSAMARKAVLAYERALALGPDDAELHYRAVIAAQYIDEQHGGGARLCAGCRDGFEAVVRHVDALRKLDPRDPREVELTWDVSIALSKLGGLGGANADAYFERAVAEYDHWHRLADDTSGDHGQSMGTAYSNAAELLMALGRLEPAIESYRLATELNPGEPLSYYGLAVAYDRDGQLEKGKVAMSEALRTDPQIQRLTVASVFFVPEGDLYYYEALAHEVRGDAVAAIEYYKRFLVRSPGNRYAARAKEHLEELAKGAMH